MLHAILDIGGDRPLHVIDLHLRAPRAAFVEGGRPSSQTWRSMPGWAEGFFLAAVKRAGQALEARLLVDALFDHDAEALIVVCGDFNADLHETPVRTIRGDEEDAGNPHLAARTLVPVERSLRQFPAIFGASITAGRRCSTTCWCRGRCSPGIAASKSTTKRSATNWSPRMPFAAALSPSTLRSLPNLWRPERATVTGSPPSGVAAPGARR